MVTFEVSESINKELHYMDTHVVQIKYNFWLEIANFSIFAISFPSCS